MRKIQLPGFQGMSVYDVSTFFLKALLDSKFTLMASAMAYQFFFSLFPILLLAYIILPFFPLEGLEEQVFAFIEQFVPNPEQSLASVNLEERLQAFSQRSPNIFLLILSALLILWGATRGITAMMKAFTKKEKVFKSRNVFQLYGYALLILFILGSLIILSVVLQNLGNYGLGSLAEMGLLGYSTAAIVGQAWSFLITLLTIFTAIAVLYFLGPATHQRWNFISPGGIAAGVLILIAMIGLKYYFKNFADFDWIYGGLGAIILLMVWFYYISIMLLIGFELNAAIDLASYQKGQGRFANGVAPKVALSQAEAISEES
ncbi:MAG: YihY/virulence factor BrkB family protein [Bacteroidota bacterium]